MTTLNGTEGNNTLAGANFADQLNAYGGDDMLFGRDGNDRLSGGSGADYEIGGRGADTVLGGSGDDTLIGDNHGNLDDPGPDGADTIYGGSGNDAVYGDGGNDFLSGGDGNDVMDGGAGSDRMTGGNGSDWLVDDAGSSSAWGDAGDDTLTISSGKANGGTGNDIFQFDWGNQGKVAWTGGADADTFHAAFYSNDGHVSQVTIADFSPAQGDHLTIEAADAPSATGMDQAATLAAEDTNHDGRLSALQPDGSGDLHISQGTDGSMSIHWAEDTVTLARMSAIDLSMFG